LNPSATHIIGCGNIGRRVASLYLQADNNAIAWIKSQASYLACHRMGLPAHRIDLDQPFKIELTNSLNRILYTVPPPPKGAKDTRLAAFLNQLDTALMQKFVLISTTGVYGDCAGAWVDESTPINPKADRALRRADAEASLQAWANRNAVDYLILRVPGIYAADRLPLKRLKAGTPVIAHNQAPWTNRIHADDLASACLAALNSQAANEIINISDDAPSSMTEYFFAVADYAGLPRPPEISLQEAQNTLSPGMLSYLAESRRIRNTKMKKLLHVNLRHPTLKHGLSSDQ
jgi:nucleoside-diphosphate-sugar epimerase